MDSGEDLYLNSVCNECGDKLLQGLEPQRLRPTVASVFSGSSSALHPLCEQVARGTMPPFDNIYECEIDDDHDACLK